MRIVLKIGGSILEPAPNPELLAAVARLAAAGAEMVIVHGGGKALSRTLARLGIATQFRQGLRVTDAATLEAAAMVFAGSVNKQLVAALNQAGAELAGGGARLRAVGMTGVDGNCVLARVEQPELGRVGAIHGGDPALLRALLAAGFTPVLAPLAGDGAGGMLNVNADQFAAACAAAIGAERVVFVTDVAGVLDAQGQPLDEVGLEELEAMVADGTISGGMLPKLAACREALAAGVGAVEIVGAQAALKLDQWAGRSCPGTRVRASAQICQGGGTR